MDERYRLGCDIGGTFTDFVLIGEQSKRVYLEKCLTTPDDPCAGVIEGVRLLERRVPGSASAISTLIHGTTLVINTLLEGKGARTALITTKGFRDVIEMRREQRYDKFDLFQDFPLPLVPRELRFGIEERMHSSGEAITPLNVNEVKKVAAILKQAQIQSVAVCLINSYANSAHEEQIAALLQDELPGVLISQSAKILPKIREYERFSTAVINAYVQPRVHSYLGDLEFRLKNEGFRGQLFLLSSEGGLISAETARKLPVRIVESGPAGGVIATERLGARLGMNDFLSFDMGGTTAKVSSVRGGRAEISAEYEVARLKRFKRGSGYHIDVPTIDLLEVGAGGGSIAGVNQFGLLQVGPQSAGAKPGPACYARGGMHPSVTDADLVLGYLNPGFFLGGRMHLDVDKAKNALTEHVAKPLNLTVEEAAWGVYDIVSENMAAAARAYMLERGENPAEMPVIAYGGAGPVHGLRVAQKLGSPVVVVPPATGALSALGFLAAEPAIMLSQTHRVRLSRINWSRVHETYDALLKEAVSLLPSNHAGEPTVRLGADMRYLGQGYTVRVDLPPADQQNEKIVTEAFEAAYRALYGRTSPDVEVEFLNLWLRASHLASDPVQPLNENKTAGAGDAARLAFFPEAGEYVSCPMFNRYTLRAGQHVKGPAIIEETESTTIVPPGANLTVHETGALLIHLNQDARK